MSDRITLTSSVPGAVIVTQALTSASALLMVPIAAYETTTMLAELQAGWWRAWLEATERLNESSNITN